MNLNNAYTQFFLKSEEGKHFMATLEVLISAAHETAEKSPESARDFTQRAKGVRSVIEHIQVSTTKPKKGGTPK